MQGNTTAVHYLLTEYICWWGERGGGRGIASGPGVQPGEGLMTGFCGGGLRSGSIGPLWHGILKACPSPEGVNREAL